MAARRAKGRAAPPKTGHDTQDPVALGKAAWERRKAEARASWPDWKLIGKALVAGRRETMKVAKTNRPAGRKYSEFFSHWLQMQGFDEIDKSDRSKLLRIMENLDAIEAYLESLPDDKRTQLNHPSAVWRAWTCPNRGNRGQPKDEAQPDSNGSDTTASEPENEEAEWQKGLLLRARKSAGDAKLHTEWLDHEPPDAGTIAAVHKAAQAWQLLADYLDWIANTPPEELAEARQGFAEHERTKAEYKALKKERARARAERAWAAA